MAEYKLIPGVDGYRAGDDGSIWSCRGRWGKRDWHKLKPCVNKRNGYLYVSIHAGGSQRTRTVHSLVMLAFVGACPKGQEVRHANNERTDCRLGNLSYGTRVQNAADKTTHGTQRSGESITHFVKTKVAVVLEIRRRAGEGESLSSLAREKGMTVGNVHAIVHRKSWKHV